jgi:hypothetical protein
MKIRTPKLGPMGEFPKGKMRPDDDGAIRIAVMNRGGKIVMDFGGPVAWIGFDPSEARAIAAALERNAAEAEAHRS